MAEKQKPMTQETLDLWIVTLHYFYCNYRERSAVEEFDSEVHTEANLKERIDKIKRDSKDHDRFRSAMAFKNSMRVKYQ